MISTYIIDYLWMEIVMKARNQCDSNSAMSLYQRNLYESGWLTGL